MQHYNCLIIEDEPIAAEVLQDYIADVPFLTLKGTAADAISAMAMLRSMNIDLIFLDINLPKLRGIDFIKILKNPPHIIITTAYQEYAIQGYELNILDYLLKPISFGRFLQSINKLKLINSAQSLTSPAFVPDGKNCIFLNTGKKKVKLYFRDIIFIESLKENVRIYTLDKIITTKFQLGLIEDHLPKSDFLRIHRSFIVAIAKIDAYTSTSIELNTKQLPIGRSYKELVMNILEGDDFLNPVGSTK